MNYKDVIEYGILELKSKNIESAPIDSELILSNILKYKRENILLNLTKKFEPSKFKSFKNLLDRRKKNEPIAHILKNKEFWKYNFLVDNNVLIPRPESELIIQETLNLIKLHDKKSILDIGTGSGCLVISVLKERPKSYATAIDISKKALNIAKTNAKIHHLQNKIRFINMDIDKFIGNKYDFIISNPPYINKFCLKRLDDNVKLFEPHIALDGGIDGFSGIRKTIFNSKKLLKKNGRLIIEIGNKQLAFSKSLLINNGFYINKICKDIQFYPRVIISTKIT